MSHTQGRGSLFGKTLSQYIGFQKAILALIALVGIARLGLSLAGQPDATVKWISLTVVGLAGILYYGVAVYVTGFGSYKQLLPLVFIQNVLANCIIIAGIVLSMLGLPNIFAAPEYSGPNGALYHSQGLHILGHVVLGMGVFSLLGWGVASLVMLIASKIARRPAQT